MDQQKGLRARQEKPVFPGPAHHYTLSTHRHTLTHTYIHKWTYIHTLSHACKHTYIHSCTHTHPLSHAYAYIHIEKSTDTHTSSHIHTHVHAHIHAHTLRHIYTHVHPHADRFEVQPPICLSLSLLSFHQHSPWRRLPRKERRHPGSAWQR